ncbi:hypothetical protein UA08_00622 [Talaromyces atroroseus]|uniref:Xylanolytic transcriptional activator regulatory domain-containing protein n=1 Tax=Talaromyces atroroseus TaxID=1441469 RepID=A0A225AQG0_TALAT|nr:hypothetical protein UA08_00622 [Talaromyces atroroseus]OKL63861.1 hypothetical protein UA08_00622 [Talaromyces atroroseus]
MQDMKRRQLPRGAARVPSGSRTLLACAKCKERKLKVHRKTQFGTPKLFCLVEDPITKIYRPRNYVEILEKRVALLESLLKQCRPDLIDSDVFAQSPDIQSSSLPSTQAIETLNPGDANRTALAKTKGNVEQDFGVDKLASNVGLLSLNAAGAEPQYLGSSSIFAFSRLINSSLRQVVSPDFPTVNVYDRAKNRSSVLPSPCLLPPYESAVKLSDIYFQNINTQYPFLHEPTFKAWESMLVDESTGLETCVLSSTSLFFLNMVYAVGALLLPSLGYSTEITHGYFTLVWMTPKGEENNELSLMTYRKLAGLALRMCIDLGYHRNAERFAESSDILQTELRKRVFWCAYVVETQAAVMLGRPLGIPYQEVDAEYPIDIDDSCITATGLVGMPRNSPGDAPTNITRAIHTFRIRRILNRIHTCIYSKADPRCSGKHDQRIDVQNIRADIEKWRSEIPPTPSYNRSGEELVLFTTEDWYGMEYNYTILQLYRAQIVDHRTETPDGVFLECMRAAENICHSYRRQFLGKPTSCTWAALHELFLAGLTYLHCLWTSPAAREASGHGKANNTCNDCTIALVIMAERWDAASPYREIFMALVSRTMAMMGDKSDESVSTNVVSADSESWVEEDWTEWMGIVADAGLLEGFNGLLTGVPNR